MSEIILTQEQKREALAGRIKAFQEGLKELSLKTKIGFKAQISPDGPIISLFEKSEDTSVK